MSQINSYKDLLVWQKGIDLAVAVYKLTKKFPQDELYALTSHVRRASYSISLNIAEGFGRNSTKSYISFLRNAKGSLDELESGLILAERLEFITAADWKEVRDIIGQEMRMLVSLMLSLELKNKKSVVKSVTGKVVSLFLPLLPIGYSLFTNK